MSEVIVLASGSSGNALLVRGGGAAVLVDAGLSARRLEALIAGCGVDPGSLAGILLTHEHGDHTRGLKNFLARHRVPVFANPLTAGHLKNTGVAAEWNLFSSGSTFRVGPLDVHAFSVPHDAADPVGFVLGPEGARFAVLTDLGYATRQVVDAVRGVNALLIETNHDADLLLLDTRRPASVKQRIASRHGHLSNAAAAALVAEIATSALAHVVLAHLSRDCNAPAIATAAVEAALKNAGHTHVCVRCAPPDDASSPVRFPLELHPRVVRAEGSQLT
jgi:phosphoribosyl 1,2-cyclic phosphodiesterase